LATFRIVCTTLKYPTQHSHIVEVGTGTDPGSADKQWTVDEVRFRLALFDKFYTQDLLGNIAWVEAYTCGCGYQTIRSEADASLANNLDNLRQCVWGNS
jgi:hypothetical protein